ncbi:MAG TPA: acetyl-CoA decarbonylase/synthase complex subunit gamma [Nitrospiraceae bacterium]|nr:MAG: acetyl-CoA decarbonylase/synthase complex subunit gamma [Nitrospirae bacterium GWB2_47_37]HAK88915.1 acetyl-CoA decarbonylase/synthase complex subunit gamma [Nitrospiraceae bacterium]HCZ11273.1 acetyl-CoA decarbonylase/synthase complex subunit gamma [Nitrospiraceae bacterium]
MALTGVEIFKLLPKTNCKKCGHPTCLAFAMKLAQRQASLDACPDVSEEAKKVLGEASAPPIRSIALGSGDKAVKMGEENVLFRHEKRFVNPCAFAVEVKDSMSDDEINNTVDGVLNSEIDRVGQKLRIDAILVSNASNDAGRFEGVVKAIASKAPAVPLIIATGNPAAAEAAVKAVADKKPLLYGADESNADAMANIAKTHKIPLGVTAKGLDALTALTEKIKGLGVEDMVIDPGARTAKEIIEANTYIRRAAIKKNFKALGYPVITLAQRDDKMVEALIAVLGVTKYSSIVVLSSIEKWKNLALFTLRQNIYTDPQVPMQVEQKVYKIGEATPESPLTITTNFSLTYFIVSGEIENSKVPTRLAVMDCEGLSVLTAWAAGKFTASKIAQFIQESGIENEISHKELIIPGYVAILSGAIEDKLPGWKVTVGPREANALPAFLKSR